MIRKPTVLVLGAGASQPYGYPLGAGLVDRIINLTQPGQPGDPAGGLRPTLWKHPAFRSVVDDFSLRLNGSETSSIDDFLESNPDYQDIGKFCIAAALTVWGPPANHKADADRHWYRYLWDRMRQGAPTPAAFRENSVRIITYNYERSLERYFASVLLSTYPEIASAGESAAVTLQEAALPVIHLHGSLGKLGDQVLSVTDPMSLNDVSFYQGVAAGIRIIHEDQLSEEYATAQAWLRQAQVVCFLGFGFHPTNIKRLALLEQIAGHSNLFWGGTAFGLEDAEIIRAETLLRLGGVQRFLHPVDSLLYVRRYAPLE